MSLHEDCFSNPKGNVMLEYITAYWKSLTTFQPQYVSRGYTLNVYTIIAMYVFGLVYVTYSNSKEMPFVIDCIINTTFTILFFIYFKSRLYNIITKWSIYKLTRDFKLNLTSFISFSIVFLLTVINSWYLSINNIVEVDDPNSTIITDFITFIILLLVYYLYLYIDDNKIFKDISTYEME